jgi:hypothetical protein
MPPVRLGFIGLLFLLPRPSRLRGPAHHRRPHARRRRQPLHYGGRPHLRRAWPPAHPLRPPNDDSEAYDPIFQMGEAVTTWDKSRRITGVRVQE